VNKLSTHNTFLYYGLTITSIVLVIISLGPGLFGMEIHESRWQHMFFEKLCHQNPHRSYSLAGVSMAVCSRCLGIYTIFAVGLLLAPLYEHIFTIQKKRRLYLVMLTVGVNAIDIAGNAMGLWANTLESRLILGSLFGLSIAMLITNEFFKTTTNSEDTYGTEFAA